MLLPLPLHADYSPSSSDRWINCGGSVGLINAVAAMLEAQPNQPEEEQQSPAAARGTRIHALFEQLMTEGVFTEEYPDEQEAEVATAAWALIKQLFPPTTVNYVEVEAKVSLAPLGMPQIYGTADLVIHGKGGGLYVIDLKAGFNQVSELTSQLKIYALGVLADLGMTHDLVSVAVLQPDIDGVMQYRQHTYSTAELLEWAEAFLKPAIETSALTPGEWCQYCPAAGICQPRQEQALAMLQEDFSDFEPENINKLPLGKLISLVKQADNIRAALKSAEGQLLELATHGLEIPGFKLVEGDKRRVWTDEESALTVLLDAGVPAGKAHKSTLVTPAQAEKLLGSQKDKIQHLITKPPGAPKLVPSDDDKPGITNYATELFGE